MAHPTVPVIHLTVTATVAIVLAALTLSALYWRNSSQIDHLRDQMKIVHSELEQHERAIQRLEQKP